MKIKRLSRTALEIVAARFRLLGDASRLELLQALSESERSVQDLCELTGLSQANVSKHLGLLSEQGLITKRREGMFVYYSSGDRSTYQLCDLVYAAVSKRYGSLARELAGD